MKRPISHMKIGINGSVKSMIAAEIGSIVTTTIRTATGTTAARKSCGT